MAGEKRFGTALFGFKKTDVNSYIEKILREFDEKLKEKDNEITALKNQCRELRIKYEDIARKAEQINMDRAKIADVLIKAQEKAEMILQEAKRRLMKKEENFLNLRAGKGKTCGYEARDKSVEAGDYQDIKEYELDLEKVVEFAGDIEGMENMNKDETKNDKSEDDDDEISDAILEEIMEEYAGKSNT